MGGIVSLLGKLGKSVPAYMNHADLPLLLESNPELDASRIIDSPDGFSLSLGTGGDAIKIRFMHTPGHSKGSQCVLVNGNRLLTGDTMFVVFLACVLADPMFREVAVASTFPILIATK